MQTEEECDSSILAYLLGQMTPDEHRQWEARLECEPALAARQRASADALATEMLGDAPVPDLDHSERGRMGLMVLTEAAAHDAPLVAPRRHRHWGWAWPAAAALLGALNLTQWAWHRPPVGNGPGAPEAAIERPAAQRVVYAEPAMLKRGGVSPAVTLTLTEKITLHLISPAMTPASGHAWYDAGRRQGLLELHDLPKPPPGAVLVLWVKTGAAANFQPVGPIPEECYGVSATATYGLPGLTQSPAQVMITVERRGKAPALPSSAIVLRGP